MDVNSRLSVQSNVESPLMHEGSEPQQITSSAAGNLAGSITACKKVLRSNSLLESTDYWLQNQRTPCQIGFVEDESENCASVCFVNLDVNKDACITENLQQKLVNVSPDLPNLISSMNVQQPKENEIVLLSGLASGNLQADFDVSQCPWLPDICLVQCARGNRPNSTNCIIFEINKFLIGLEVVQERQLHLETNVLKLEDDTNCSLSSIEEDFLTASEHLEEEIEVDDCRTQGLPLLCHTQLQKTLSKAKQLVLSSACFQNIDMATKDTQEVSVTFLAFTECWELVMGCMPFHLCTWRQSQIDLCKPKGSLVFIYEFQDSYGYTMRPCLKNIIKMNCVV